MLRTPSAAAPRRVPCRGEAPGRPRHDLLGQRLPAQRRGEGLRPVHHRAGVREESALDLQARRVDHLAERTGQRVAGAGRERGGRAVTTGVPIVKTNGTGNEFVLVDERIAPLADPVAFALEICDRERGLGADGVLLLQASERFDARLRIINSDGSDAEMCGNGMRCVGRYLDEHDGRDAATVETLAGPVGTRVLSRAPYRIAVEMGEPAIGAPHDVGGYRATPVDLGNPHVVIRVDDVHAVDLAADDPRIEHDPRYPNRTTVHFRGSED